MGNVMFCFNCFKFFSFCFILLTAVLPACNQIPESDYTIYYKKPVRKTLYEQLRDFRYAVPPVETKMIEYGLVDIQTLDPTIVVNLKYSTTDNFLGKNMYEGMQRAYLQPEVAQRLVRAQKYLKQIDPEISLIVFDATRPNHIQQKMWDALDIPVSEKIKFLSNPAYGSVHSFGAAVDVGLIDIHGILLEMGTEFDHLGELAYPSLEKEMLEQGRLEPYHVSNRALLRRVMHYGGFWGIQTEWWHFNAYTRAQARELFPFIE
jgi:zinc D-Ala-D-Ala dipeptidase